MTHFFCTTVGRKTLVAVTGFAISGFALLHMSGNLLLFAGAEAYNKYCYQLTHNKAFAYTGEVILGSLFLVHILVALRLAWLNRQARFVKPVCAGSGEKRATFASRTMVYTGLLLLVFLVWHLKSFRFGEETTVVYDGVTMRDLYSLVVHEFQETGEIIFYCFSVLVLGLHLSHGISALFQSLGLASSGSCKLRLFAYGFALIVAGGFLSQPLYLYFAGGR